MWGCSALGISVTTVCLTSVVTAGPLPVIEPLILEGDALGGFVVSTVKKPSINNDGTWLVEVDTSGPQGADEMIVRNGVVLLTEDEPVAAPAGAVVESFDGLALDNAGNSLLGMFLDGTGGFDNNAGVYFNNQLVKQLADLMDAPGLSPGTPFSNLRDVKLNDAGLALVVGSVSDPNIPGSGDEAIFTIDTTTGEETLLAIESGLLPGSPDAVLQFLAEPQHSALNNQGVAAFMVDFVGDNASDIAIYVGGDLIAREGDPSPIPGRNWTGLAIGLDINNSGGHAFTGRLDGDPSTEIVVMANGQVIAQEGDLSPSGHVIDVFSSLVRIDDNNNVLWYWRLVVARLRHRLSDLPQRPGPGLRGRLDRGRHRHRLHAQHQPDRRFRHLRQRPVGDLHRRTGGRAARRVPHPAPPGALALPGRRQRRRHCRLTRPQRGARGVRRARARRRHEQRWRRGLDGPQRGARGLRQRLPVGPDQIGRSSSAWKGVSGPPPSRKPCSGPVAWRPRNELPPAAG